MKTLILVLLLASNCMATAPIYRGEDAAQSSSGSKSNIVPVVAIVTGVITLGYVIFKVKKQQARKEQFNIYVRGN